MVFCVTDCDMSRIDLVLLVNAMAATTFCCIKCAAITVYIFTYLYLGLGLASAGSIWPCLTSLSVSYKVYGGMCVRPRVISDKVNQVL